MTRCLSQGGLYLWEAVQMEVDTTTIHMLLSEVVTGLFQWISMSLAVHQQLRPCFMDFCSYKRRLAGERISFIGGPSEAHSASIPSTWLQYGKKIIGVL